ncbi:hypothetical protein [Pseudomonas sp. PSPC3-3]|uniref:hypothetical protein n=1 Tax=unclassified Pseudomonas TaxID=196821 RepID=UPI003CF04AAA
MSEVTKFKIIGYMVERSRVGGAEYVMLSDFDRVTAERNAALGREAALREQIASANECALTYSVQAEALQQRLTAADERADVLEGRKGDLELSLMWVRSQLTDAVILRFIDIALKPSEGGGDEVICTLCMDHKTIKVSSSPWAQGCPDCCGEEG